MGDILITVNDEEIETNVEPRTHLADFLRENLRLTGTHLACEHGICGACTVLLDDEPVRSCLMFAIACNGRNVKTIEGFEDDIIMDQLRNNFNKEHALQCGFCTPGMLITARDVVLRSTNLNEEQVRIEMSGNLCRCTGYRGIIRAILNVISVRTQSSCQKKSIKSISDVIDHKPFEPKKNPNIGSNNVDYDHINLAMNEKSMSQISNEFVVNHSHSYVWNLFNDIPSVVNCIPGASIIDYQENTVKGKLTAKLGPIQTEFTGSVLLNINENNDGGYINGSGTDSLSGTRAKGEIKFEVFEEKNNITRILLTIVYELQGPLMQFSRDGIIKEFIKNIITDFSKNLDVHLSNGSMNTENIKPAYKISMGKFLWRLFSEKIKYKLSIKNRDNL